MTISLMLSTTHLRIHINYKFIFPAPQDHFVEIRLKMCRAHLIVNDTIYSEAVSEQTIWTTEIRFYIINKNRK